MLLNLHKLKNKLRYFHVYLINVVREYSIKGDF